MKRLLNYFIPENYNLTLAINRTTEQIKGTVIISGEPKFDHIELHAVDMQISSVQIDGHPAEFTHHDGILSLPNAKQIVVIFTTSLRHDMQGCYLSHYEYEGHKELIATTQFESHYARTAFPCIDEPAAKATFDLTLKVMDYAPGDIVLANTPQKSQEGNTFVYETTPRMSTYLLAWVIGKFHCVETTNKHGVKIVSYAALNQPATSLAFANEVAARAIDYYDEKFGEPYPLPKLDQVAIPDFEAGAMENWGLVTYRESMMLAAPDAAISTKSSVAVTITHELSHQWFGDLVTMNWWDDLWLNESFASIMEYYCADALYPEFNVWEDFYTGDCIAALRRDSLKGVQAVKQEVNEPAEIATLFDAAIVYAKGARLILMLIHLLGVENFDKGLRDYFKKHKYGNTSGDDLWAALQPYADFDVKDFMNTWISQPGYPMIREGKEQRFLSDGTTDDSKWPLPEIYDDMSGHYLLALTDEEFTEKLARFNELSMEQKLRLLTDRSLLAKTPAVKSDSLIDLIPKFAEEKSGAVLLALNRLVADVAFFCDDGTTADENCRKFIAKTFTPIYRDVNLGNLASDTNAINRRDVLLSLAHYARDPEIAQKLTEPYQDDLSQIDSELVSFVLVATLHSDEAKFFPIFLQKYQNETSPELKHTLLTVLARYVELPENLSRTKSLLETPAIVRPQDHIYLFARLLVNPKARADILGWLYSHWDYIIKLTGEKSTEDYVRCAAGSIRTREEADEFYKFFDTKRDLPILTRAIDVAHTDIEARLKLLASDAPAVHAKLQSVL